ncbi:MAG: ABC transporter ATP-binding protein [Treponema sp.]|nr:ABC transporter ATP-binding protein [Treponema sp.]
MENKTPILQVKDLTVDYMLDEKRLRACDNASIDIYRGEILGIIGESGSGKTTFSSGLLRLIRPPGKISSGTAIYHRKDGRTMDLFSLSDREFNTIRWASISSVFQAAQNVLNPSLKVFEHFMETSDAHGEKLSKAQMIEKASGILSLVRLEPRVLESYPHQLSGGMKQRVIIAMSLLLTPDIIFLDEPTTALDVITQWYIMDILIRIHRESGVTMVFLTHDLSIVGSIADRLAVMYAGQFVEIGPTEIILENPTHPYTYGLLNAVPSLRDDLMERKPIPGHPPNLLSLPEGCRFSPRCFAHIDGKCPGTIEFANDLRPSSSGLFTRCGKWEEVLKK